MAVTLGFADYIDRLILVLIGFSKFHLLIRKKVEEMHSP